MSRTAIFEHIGAARHYEGTLRIDIKTMQAVISRSDIHQLVERWPVDVYDISDVMRTAGQPEAVGRAWISRSGKAVMYTIRGTRYASPLAQVNGVLHGTRKYAGVSVMTEAPLISASSSCHAEGVPA